GGHLGWADRVAGTLAERRPGFRYANLAIRGKLLGQVVADQVPRAIELAPDLVSLAAGGNDILCGTDVDALASLFEPAVAKLQAAGCRVLIFTGFDPRMFPVIRLLRGRIAAYNMHLRGIADEAGCDLVDLWSMRALNDPRAWSPDRLHLTAEGHRRVALRTCEILGVPVTQDWRVPLPAAADGAGRTKAARWLAARRQDTSWARQYAMPWVRRRLTGASSGDGVPPKRPDLLPLLPALPLLPRLLLARVGYAGCARDEMRRPSGQARLRGVADPAGAGHGDVAADGRHQAVQQGLAARPADHGVRVGGQAVPGPVPGRRLAQRAVAGHGTVGVVPRGPGERFAQQPVRGQSGLTERHRQYGLAALTPGVHSLVGGEGGGNGDGRGAQEGVGRRRKGWPGRDGK